MASPGRAMSRNEVVLGVEVEDALGAEGMLGERELSGWVVLGDGSVEVVSSLVAGLVVGYGVTACGLDLRRAALGILATSYV